VAKLGFGKAVGRGGVRGGWGIGMRVFLKRRVRNGRGEFLFGYIFCAIYIGLDDGDGFVGVGGGGGRGCGRWMRMRMEM